MSKGNSSSQSQPIVASNGHTEAEEPAAWAALILAAREAGITEAQMQAELGASPQTQRRWIAGEIQPRDGTQRLMRRALADLMGHLSGEGSRESGE